MHGHRSKQDPWIAIRPDALITNTGELPTTISEVQVECRSLRTVPEGSLARVPLEPIRIQGKDTIPFKNEIVAEGVSFLAMDCKLWLTFYFTDNSAESNSVISTYREILPLPHTEHKRPTL